MAVVLTIGILAALSVNLGLLPLGSPQAVASQGDSPEVVSSTSLPESPVADMESAGESANSEYTATIQQAASERWGVDRVQAVEAVQSAGPLSRVIVAVIDTGIDETHSTLSDKVLVSINLTGNGNTDDENGHGTHMAGTIVAIAPNAALLNVKGADKRGRCDTETVATAIRWAVNHGALVINVSLEVPASAHLQEAITYAWQKGAIVIAAAGNDGSTLPAYPAAYSDAVAVASTNQDNKIAVLSNHGDWVDISAPGYKIYSELPGTEFGYETGTSPAAAHVSGVAALLFAVATDTSGNGLLNDEVRSALESSAMPLATAGMGSGLVNAQEAILALAA